LVVYRRSPTDFIDGKRFIFVWLNSHTGAKLLSMNEMDFEWDDAKDMANQYKQGVSFSDAQYTFLDKNRVLAKDLNHSKNEQRYYCFGLNETKNGVLTVRFTYRSGCIRIIGAGYWRKGKKVYEKNNSI